MDNAPTHAEWIGLAQPIEGLVVTSAVLKDVDAHVTWPVAELQAMLAEQAGEGKIILDLRSFFREILGWSDEYVVVGDAIPDSLRKTLDGGEDLVPQFALKSADDDSFVLLVGQTKVGFDLDAASGDERWTATAYQRFERLMRETAVHVGLLTNGRVFRLIYAPKKESAGWINFKLAEMLKGVEGRPLLGAFHMLLNQPRLLTIEPELRLPGLLKTSREFQNKVSTELREQILGALRDLLGGFQDADRLAGGRVLADFAEGDRHEVYSGLVTVLMRMVFILYAEERGLLPMESDLYASAYSLTRLFAQLTEDSNTYGATVNQRYGAWPRIITLFRLLHDGVNASGRPVKEGDAEVYRDGLHVPARRGDFFRPDAFPFLEGRGRGAVRQLEEVLDLPRISDGVVLGVLKRLLVLRGERLQYKGLDVEQVGSVYEGLMGFDVEVAQGDSLALKPEHVVVDLEAVLARPDRGKRVKELAGLDLKDKALAAVRDAETIEALHAALARHVSDRYPAIIPKGSLYLQPGEERRKTGSHYTPRSLTQPIVETTLRPILERLGPEPTPDQILGLKVCDPAMGSGAFLVETCRQLAEPLVAAWRRTGTTPELPPDEYPLLRASRLVAQRCLYGVDKNPLAVDLARLSMWLVTFAKEHPFTFVDHALRCGDSLVGLSREQIVSMNLDVTKGMQVGITRPVVERAVERAEQLRRQIHAIGDPPDTARLSELWREADEALDVARNLGDLVVAAFFSADSDKARRKAVEGVAQQAAEWLQTGAHDAELRGMIYELREGPKPIRPFHWEIEFPEVFTDGSGAASIGGEP